VAPHPGSGEPLGDINIRNQVITFPIAGHETTSGALSFALNHLASNPAVLARAQDEVDAGWGDAESRPSRSGQAPVPAAVLDESLRLWPTRHR
jgi:cytochrome P450/NADPH-cytochrome P450 reductase